MKRVVSVSLGSSRRNKVHEVELFGEKFSLERRGTDGDFGQFRALLQELDGNVAAIGLGGVDRYVVAGGRRYAFRQVDRAARLVKQTPVVDGSGLKNTLERLAITRLTERDLVDWSQERVLLVSAVDRFGMAEALAARCPDVIFGDLYFALGLPIPIRHMNGVRRIGAIVLPIITQLPIQWFYPTGAKQETRNPKFPKLFKSRTLIAGDWHFIRRHVPDDLGGKTIITQTLREADLRWLTEHRASRVITTTPAFGGETFATNVLEALIVAWRKAKPEDLTTDDFQAALRQLSWEPLVHTLGSNSEGDEPSGTNEGSQRNLH